MAACPKTLSPIPLPFEGKFQDSVFISDTDTDEGLLVLNDDDYKRSTQPAQLQLKRADEEEKHSEPYRESDKVVQLLVADEMDVSESDDHSDDDFISVVVEEQPRRASEPITHFQPSQIEEKLLNHRLLSDAGDADKRATTKDSNNASQANGSPRRRRSSIWNGMVACLTPVMGYFKKEKQPKPQQDEWEIDFADISELDFIGSGAQGAVFAGEYLGKKVAVKKVKDPKYCEEAWNLRKLDHPNIVKLM